MRRLWKFPQEVWEEINMTVLSKIYYNRNFEQTLKLMAKYVSIKYERPSVILQVQLSNNLFAIIAGRIQKLGNSLTKVSVENVF